MNKFFRPILVLCTVLALASCSTDDNGGSSDTSGDIVGTWEMVTFDYEGTSTTEFDGETFTADFVGVGQNIDYTIEFTENPNEFSGQGSYDIELSTTIAGQTTTQVESINDTTSTGSYEISGNTITFDGVLVSAGSMAPTMGTEGSVGTISELTDSTLVLTQEATEMQSVNGATISITIVSETVFTRL